MPPCPAQQWILYQKKYHLQHFPTQSHHPSVEIVRSFTETTITVLDGVRQTVTLTKIKLCPTHPVPDSMPPPPQINLKPLILD